MDKFYLCWGISAAVLILLAVIAGKASSYNSALGILIDDRGRFSMTHLQLVIWNFLILSSFAAVFFVTWELQKISPELLGLLGISVGSAATAGAVKSGKDIAGKNIARVGKSFKTASGVQVTIKRRFSQVFLEEEGGEADNVVSITKFQNFVFTIVLAILYVVLTIRLETPGMPEFTPEALWLIGISHGGYIAGKIPDRP